MQGTACRACALTARDGKTKKSRLFACSSDVVLDNSIVRATPFDSGKRKTCGHNRPSHDGGCPQIPQSLNNAA
jgi:hypothetical protein